MDVFAKAAGLGAINLTLLWKEGASQQGGLTLSAGEAGLCGMPVLPVIGHLCMVHTCFKRDRKILRCCGEVWTRGNLWVTGIYSGLCLKAMAHSVVQASCEAGVALSAGTAVHPPHIWLGVVLTLPVVGYICCQPSLFADNVFFHLPVHRIICNPQTDGHHVATDRHAGR